MKRKPERKRRMKNYFKYTLGVILAVATFVSIGCSSTKAKNPSADQNSGSSSQSTTGASQSTTDQTAASTPGSDTLEGCVFKRHTELYLEPANGGAATKISSSGKDVSTNVGQNVRLSGNTQNSASSSGSSSGNTSSSSSGNMSGSSSGNSASGEPEFVVTRVDVVAKECPADIQSRVDQDKKSKK
jgi:hypothetical protein